MPTAISKFDLSVNIGGDGDGDGGGDSDITGDLFGDGGGVSSRIYCSIPIMAIESGDSSVESGDSSHASFPFLCISCAMLARIGGVGSLCLFQH